MQQQGDLVVKGFKSLISKYDPNGDKNLYPRPVSKTLLISGVEFKRELMNQLRSHLLPMLEQQITSLSVLLHHSHLDKEPILTFQRILDIQTELDQTLNSIQSAIYTLCPEPEPYLSGRINDQHLKEFKCFRLDGIYYIIKANVMDEVIVMFRRSSNLIHQLGFTTRYHASRTSLTTARRSVTKYTAASCTEINSTIRWLQGTELDLVQFDWPSEIRSIDDPLEQLSRLTDPTGRLNETNVEPGNVELMKQVTALARSILPIAKLSRIFLNKVSRRGMNDKRFPLFTGMRSDQLHSLSELAEEVPVDIEKFLPAMRDAGRVHRSVTQADLTGIAEDLHKRFESALFLISFYLVPLIQDVDDFPAQKYYKTWLATWYDQFSLAVQNLEDACKSFQWVY
ncbi:hypothetical protein Pst134EB_012526 [Puccinia striiformis f. sp. tritici]|nr:hypothetical protein Pst134EB_012526 [Puccinia striiformis f. sp. tritici]